MEFLALFSCIDEETEFKEIMWLAQGHTTGNKELRVQPIIINSYEQKKKKIKSFSWMDNSYPECKEMAEGSYRK